MSVTGIVTFMPAVQERLYTLAEDQAGLFTTSQAEEAGISRRMLSHYARTGLIERRSHGIYRLRLFPHQRFEDLIETTLWAGEGSTISHESALAVYDLADAMPSLIHLTVPRRFRGKRAGVLVHRKPLTDSERTVREAVPVTTIERTVVDVLQDGDPDVARRAAIDALHAGLTTRNQLERALDSRRIDAKLLVLPEERGRP